MGTLTGNWSEFRNTNHGPWRIGSDLWAISALGNNTIRVQKSTDDGATWTTVQTYNPPGNATSTILNVTGDVYGTVLYICFSTVVGETLTGWSGVVRYDTVAGTWNTTGLGSMNSIREGVTGACQFYISAGSDGRNAVIFQATMTAVMGGDYRRVWGTVYSPAYGQSLVQVSLTANDQVHYDAYATVSVGTRSHFFYTGLTTGGVRTLRHRVATGAYVLQTEQVVATIQNSNYPVGQPWTDGTSVYVPYVNTSGVLVLATATSADSPSWTTGVAVSDSGQGPESVNANPGSITHDGTDWHAFWINDAQTAILRDKTASGSWGTDATFAGGLVTYDTAATSNNPVTSLTALWGQSFTAQNTSLATAKIVLGSDAQPSDVQLLVATDSAGVDVLATSSTLTITNSFYTERTFIFPSPATLTLGNTYYLIVSLVSGGSLRTASNTGNPYAGGDSFGLGGSGIDTLSGGYPSGYVGPVNGISIGHIGSGAIGVLYDNNGVVTFDTYGAGPPVLSLDGTITGSSAVSGSTTSAETAAGTVTGSSATSASTTSSKATTGSVTGSSAVSGNATAQRFLAATGTVTGSSSASATASKRSAISGTITGSSAVSGQTSIAKVLQATGTITGSSATSATTTSAETATGTVSGSSAVSGDATATEILQATGSVTGNSSVSGSANSAKSASGSVAGDSATSATAFYSGLPASGSVTGSSSIAANTLEVATLSGSLAGSSSVSGNAFYSGLPASGSISGSSDAAAQASLSKTLTGSVTGSSSLSGVTTLAESASGAVDASSQLTGNASSTKSVSGTIDGSSLLTGEADTDSAVGSTGHVTGSSALSADTLVAVTATGSTAGSSATSAEALFSATLSGAIDGSSQLTGSATSTRILAATGVITGSSSAIAEAAMAAYAAGVITGLSDVSGYTDVVKDVSGVIAGSSDVFSLTYSEPQPWPAIVTFSPVLDGPAIAASLVLSDPAVSFTDTLDPVFSLVGIGDAPATIVSEVASPLATLASVADGPATSIEGVSAPSATFMSIPGPSATFVDVPDGENDSGEIPGPSAVFIGVPIPSGSFGSPPGPTFVFSEVPELVTTVTAISDGPAIAATVYNMPEE